MKPDPQKWYFNTYVYIIAFLCIGPFALPLALINPRYSVAKKILVAMITLLLSILMAISVINSTRTISKYYQQAFQSLKEGNR